MGWLSLATALLKVVGAIADYLQQRQLLDAGAKAQLARELVALNQRLSLGIKIQQEDRSVDEDIAILAGTNTAATTDFLPAKSDPGTG